MRKSLGTTVLQVEAAVYAVGCAVIYCCVVRGKSTTTVASELKAFPRLSSKTALVLFTSVISLIFPWLGNIGCAVIIAGAMLQHLFFFTMAEKYML